MTRPTETVRLPTWRSVNISPGERAGRVAIGLAAAIAGTVLLTAAGSVLAVILEAALVVAGLDMIVTGATGHCPLYRKLGRTLKAPRSTP